VRRAYGGSRCGDCVKQRILRAFLVEEAKIVKKVIKSQLVEAGYVIVKSSVRSGFGGTERILCAVVSPSSSTSRAAVAIWIQSSNPRAMRKSRSSIRRCVANGEATGRRSRWQSFLIRRLQTRLQAEHYLVVSKQVDNVSCLCNRVPAYLLAGVKKGTRDSEMLMTFLTVRSAQISRPRGEECSPAACKRMLRFEISVEKPTTEVSKSPGTTAPGMFRAGTDLLLFFEKLRKTLFALIGSDLSSIRSFYVKICVYPISAE